MKLPQILAQTVPPGIPTSRGHGDVGEEYLIAAQGISKVGETLSRAILSVAERKRKAEEALRKEEIAGETANLQATFETQVSDIESAIKTTITEHGVVVPEWRQQIEKAVGATVSQARHPESATALRRKLPAIVQSSYARMLDRRDKLRLDSLEVEALDTADKQMALARKDSLYDDQTFVTRIDDIYAALKPLVPMKGEAAVFKQAEQIRDQMRIERAKRFADTDPQGFIDAADTNPLYADLPQAAKQEALTHARTVLNQRAGQWDKFFDQVEKEAEAERQSQLAALSDTGARGELTPAKVRDAVVLNIIQGRIEFEHYMTMATTPAKETPSDPTTLTAVNTGVWATTGSRYTTDQIEALMTRHRQGGPGLNAADGKLALIEIRRQGEFKLTRADQLRRDEHEKQKESYQIAKGEGLAWLGITTPMSQLDGPATALVARFTSDLNARVLDRDGNFIRPSREALYELLPIYLDRQSQDAKLDYAKNAGLLSTLLKTQIPDPTDIGWNAWYQQQQQAIESLKSKNPNLYDLRRTQLQELARQKTLLIETEARRGALGGSPVSRPGQAPIRYQPPAAVRP